MQRLLHHHPQFDPNGGTSVVEARFGVDAEFQNGDIADSVLASMLWELTSTYVECCVDERNEVTQHNQSLTSTSVAAQCRQGAAATVELC